MLGWFNALAEFNAAAPKKRSLNMLGLVCSAMASFAHADNAQLDIQLTPVVKDGLAVAIDVTEHIRLDTPLPSLVIAEKLGPLVNIDQRLVNIQLSDQQGPLTLSTAQAAFPDALGTTPRAWRTDRPTVGEVVLRYRAKVSHDTIAGPTWEVRSEARGISAAGYTFLLLPEDQQTYKVSLSWDLSALANNATAIDSLPTDGQVTMHRLGATYFMAGDLHRLPADPKASGPFRAASTADTTQFSQASLLSWAHQAYVKYSDFFGFAQQPPFTVLFRDNPIIDQSGTELPDALMVAAAKDTPFSHMREILSHEMVHVFLHGPEDASWFQEGLAVMYENRALYALGLIDDDEYLSAVNNTVQTYYANVKKFISMDAAQAAFWTDARARLQPYYRGGMYFITTDSRLRKTSQGKVTLDQLLREFLQAYRDGKSVTGEDWLALVRSHLGEAADRDYHALQEGGLLVPEDEAFGRCFTRQTVQVPVFELGFDISSLMQRPRVITGLVPDSPAAKAGLREGDRVSTSTGLDAQQAKHGEPLTLVAERDGKQVPISFIPQGPLTESYQWVKTTNSLGDSTCRH